MSDKPISIVVPHYNTPTELNLCLACINHYSREPIEILVVDNGSTEEVLESLTLPTGARLLKRRQSALDQDAHKAALDMGVEHAVGDLIVTMHSDAFVLRSDWLSYLKDTLEDRYLIAGPNTHRLTPQPLFGRLKRRLKKQPAPTMIRPLFAIYRTEVFKECRFMDFADVGRLSTAFLESGRARFIPRDEAVKYVFHVGGTTRLANLNHRGKARRRKARQFAKLLKRPEIIAVG